MELGTEISQKLKKTIKKQLQTLGSYVDDELPEYIMVMIGNKRTKDEMVEELHLFLNDEAGKFVNWLLGVLEKIQKAIQLTCLKDEKNVSTDSENLSEDGNEKGRKNKKKSNKQDDEKSKRKFTEKKEVKENLKDNINVDRKKRSRSNSMDKRKRSRSKSKDRRRSRSKDRRRSRSKSRSRTKRRQRSRSKSVNRRRSRSKDRRNSRSKDRRHRSNSRSRSKDNRRSRSKLHEERYSSTNRDRSISRERKHSLKEETIKALSPRLREETHDVEKASVDESVEKDKIEKDLVNPMEFVKRIAKDINDKLAGKQVTREEIQVKGEVELDSTQGASVEKDKIESVNVVEASCLENVSLQAVGQYDDGDNNNDNDKIVKSLDKKIDEHHDKKHRERKESRRSRSRSRSAARRNRSRSRSKSPRRNRRRSEDYRKRRSRSLTRRRVARRHSPHTSRRIDRRRSYDEHKEKERMTKDRQRSPKRNKTEEDKPKESVKRPKEEEEGTDKEKLASQITIANDLKRKPSLGKSLQACSNLLKKAMNEAVSETQKKWTEDGGDEEVNGEEELDYSEDNTESALHVEKELKDSVDRRFIDFSQKSAGLATITINFKSPYQSESENDGEKMDGDEDGDDDADDIALRKGLLQDMSKVDARYAIIKSRLDQKETKVSHERREKSENSERRTKSAVKDKPHFLGSMIADLEEKSNIEMKKRHKYERRQDRKRLIETERHERAGKRRLKSKGRGSSDEEILSAEQVRRLTEESRRIKMQEVKRNMTTAREGDLRSLLEGKRRRDSGISQAKSSASDDEEEVERKLREKIKEEKHMRLFGKLNRGERDRLSREREELRSKLDRTRNREKKRNDRKLPLADKNCSDETKNKTQSQDAESSGSDQWVESGTAREKNDEKDKEVDNLSDWDEAPTNERSYILEEDGQRQENIETEEQVEKEEDKKELEISKDILLASVHKEESVKQLSDLRDELKAENSVIENDKKLESKQKKVRQEFIVTLDGFENTKEKEETVVEPQRSRRHSHARKKKREKSSSFTQSDEEFEEILRKKQKEEEEAVSRHHSSRRTRRSHRTRKSRSRSRSPDSAEMNEIDREIMIAEKKLKAQKLLKKSLDQVQSLNTENFSFESKKPKTAFVNPHFKPKVDIPVMNVLPLNVAGQPIVAPQTIHSTAPLAVQPTSMLQQHSQTGIATNMNNKMVTLPVVSTGVEHLTDIPPIPSQQPNNSTVSATQATSLVTSPTIETNLTIEQEIVSTKASAINPQTPITKNIPCKMFPNCSFGKRCLYLHPACKFAERCTNIHCIFNHDDSTSTSTTLCKFFPNCMNKTCPFKHPIQKLCRFGVNCTNTDCLFTHDNSNDTKWVATKPKSHISERKFAVDNGVVSNPVSIVTTSTTETKPSRKDEQT